MVLVYISLDGVMNVKNVVFHNNMNEQLQKNTEDLIKRICIEIDNIEDSFDILDNDFNERVKSACAKDKSHVKRLSEN